MNRPTPPGEISRELVHRNPHQAVYRVRARVDGADREYYIADFGVRVGLLAVRAAEVLLVRQYRYLVGRDSWEIPGGRTESGEDPAEAAVRECLEETGVRCAAPRLLLDYEVGLDTVDNPTLIYLSTEPAPAEPGPVHGHEVKGSRWFPLEEALGLAARGEITDQFTLLALLAYRFLGPAGQQPPR